MNKILFLCFILFSVTPLFAKSGRKAWHATNPEGQKFLLQEYKSFYREFSQTEKLDQFSNTQSSFLNFFFSSAWAVTEGMDCIYAGWPSKRVSGSCSSPARHNPGYATGGCSSQELQCQPLLFGAGQCVPVRTQQQRSLAFSTCDKNNKNSPEKIIQEIKASGKENELMELLDFADKTCSQGKQAGTGMCRRLEAAVDRMRHVLPESDAAKEEVKAEEDSPASPDSPEVVEDDNDKSSVEIQNNQTDEVVRTVPTSEVVQTVINVNEKISTITSPEDCEPAQTGTPFERDEPRPLDFEYSTSKRGRDPAWSDTFLKDKTQGLRPTGFNFRSTGPNAIAGNPIDPKEKVERDWRFVSEDNSKRETYLWITDDAGSGYLSQLMETIILFVPRKMQPSVEAVGDELHVTLATGEKVVYDKATKLIKRGILSEGKIDLEPNRFNRKFAPITYSGTGISIRLDKRGSDPRLGGDATVTQNGKTCKVPAQELWKQEDFRYADDLALVTFLNRKCGPKFSL